MSEVEQEIGPYDPYQHAQALEEENKSLRESIADLQLAVEFYAGGEGDVLDWDRVNNFACIQDRGKHAREALERLKARGHHVEENK